MATYVIGDVQGCFVQLNQLLEKINFSSQHDTLWFAGDLINRGNQSLEVLRFIKGLGKRAVCVLGNHDLHFLGVRYGHTKIRKTDTFQDILRATDCDSLCEWLLTRPLLHHDKQQHATLVHAGLAPQWDLITAKACAEEVAHVLQHPTLRHPFLSHMYGNRPNHWKPTLNRWRRLRFITNCLTRIRYVTVKGRLNFKYKGTINNVPKKLIPWFNHPQRQTQDEFILFGHWAALMGQTHYPDVNVIALDTGCCWGGALTAFCLETKRSVSVPCDQLMID